MKRSTRVFGDRVLRSRRRLFATTVYQEDVKRARLSPLAVEKQEIKIKFKVKLGESQGENGEEQEEKIKLGEIKKVEGEEQQEEIEIKLGESKKTSLVDHNHDVNVRCSKQFGAVYTRKRKRTIPKDPISNCITFEEKLGSDNRYAKKYFKKVKTSLRSDCRDSKTVFDGKDVLLKGSDISSSHCSYGSGDSSSSCSNHQVSCFSNSNDIRFLQDSTPLFTVDMNSLPFCFLYIHSTLLLKYALLSYGFIVNSVDENVVNGNKDDHVKLPLTVTTQKDQTLDKHTIVRKARSARKTVPRVALFKKPSPRNVWAHVENIVPVPGVREIEGYGGDEYVPFKLPELYISSRSDEVTRSLEKSYPIYDMDSDDEQWLKELNNERFGDNNEPLSEDSFEKIIDAFERGSYCTPDCFSDAASAIDRCSRLASKENLEAVYSYWMTKRKKKRSTLIRVFQCYSRRRVRRYLTSAVIRKKRSSRRRASQRCAGKQLDFFKAIMNDENKLAKELVKVHEAEEGARRAEAAAIVKRKEAQSAMETADLATYRAAMALRIAAEIAAAESVVNCL